MSFTSLLSQRCIIYRKVQTKDDTKGLITSTWSTIAEDVPCRVDYQFITSTFVSQTPNGQITGNDYVGYFLPDTDIQHADRILWESTYLFVRPINRSFASASLHHLEVALGLQET